LKVKLRNKSYQSHRMRPRGLVIRFERFEAQVAFSHASLFICVCDSAMCARARWIPEAACDILEDAVKAQIL
jgi:hypothetical protein